MSKNVKGERVSIAVQLRAPNSEFTKGCERDMKMYLISDNIDTQTGMRLAGIEGVVVHEADALKKVLDEVVKNREIGIVLITEKLGRLLPAYIKEIKLNYRTPLIVEIPDRHGTGRTRDSITRYVREAIGLRI